MRHDDVPLPKIEEAILDRAALAELFGDIRTLAQGVSVQVKAGAEAYAESEGDALERAHEAIIAGRVMGVQIRYQLDGDEWCDTLLANGAVTKLVRMRQAGSGGK